MRLTSAGSDEAAESFVAGQQRTFTRITIIVAGGASIAALHHSTPHFSLLWHNVVQLYYLPVVYAATYFGLWGGLGAAALAALGYIPRFLEAAEHTPDLVPVQLAEVAVLFLVSGVTGMLADREHKQRHELLAPAATKDRITLRQDESPGLPSVECDPEQIRQVILNMTLTAIQAMPEGGEVVLSGCQEGSHVLIEIRDQGHGIAAEDLAKVFEPFFTTKENGTGLGLPVVRQIVAQHQGTISARKNKGKGMTFSLRLPLHRRKVT
jgi:signal transduction histidine kinase